MSLARVHDPVVVLGPSIVGGIESDGRLIWHIGTAQTLSELNVMIGWSMSIKDYRDNLLPGPSSSTSHSLGIEASRLLMFMAIPNE